MLRWGIGESKEGLGKDLDSNSIFLLLTRESTKHVLESPMTEAQITSAAAGDLLLLLLCGWALCQIFYWKTECFEVKT
jgi:hypothetical protein